MRCAWSEFLESVPIAWQILVGEYISKPVQEIKCHFLFEDEDKKNRMNKQRRCW